MTTENQTLSLADTQQRLLLLEQQFAQLRSTHCLSESPQAVTCSQLFVHPKPSRVMGKRLAARGLAVGAGAAALLMAAGAVSQGTCPAGIPFCFQAGAVIRAAEVNSNFAAVATSLTGKLGVTAQGDVDVAGTLGLKIKTKTCTASVAGAAQCVCDTGELAIGGGAAAPTGAFLATSRPKASERTTWEVHCRKADGTDATCSDIRAVCAQIKAL